MQIQIENVFNNKKRYLTFYHLSKYDYKTFKKFSNFVQFLVTVTLVPAGFFFFKKVNLEPCQTFEIECSW